MNIGKFFNAINPLDMFNANQMQKLKAYYNNNGISGTAQAMFKDYFSGGQLQFGPTLGKSIDSDFARRARTGAAIGLAGYGLSQTIFQDSAIENVADFAFGAGLHGSITAGLYKYNKAYGIGYGAWAGLNFLRSGNNAGPF